MTNDLKTCRESTRFPGLFVQKYTRKVFYDNLWTPELIESRGAVIDAQGNTVIRPFTKIFNRYENGTDINLNTVVLAIQKINGFMAAVTYVPSVGKTIVSTTGSLDSEYVDMAEEILPESAIVLAEYFKENPITFLYEIVHPNDPHIIKEQLGAYLIGSRVVSNSAPYSTSLAKEKLLDILAHRSLGIIRPTWFYSPFREIVEKNRCATHEGFVVYSKDQALKIKSPFYLVSKFFGRQSKNKIHRLIKDPMSFKRDIDEEFYPLVDAIAAIKDEFVEFTEQERIDYIQKFLRCDDMTKYAEFFGN